MIVHRLDSQVLRGNPLGDPTERDLHVYVPPGYEGGAKRLPVLLALTGFTGTGGMLFNVDPLGEDLRRRLDRLITSGRCPPVLVAAPDCFNRFGGSQYINSSAIGRYEDYLLEEVIPFVSATYATGSWGVVGKSSGGYGAILLGMRHPQVFRALADHSGDANFELCYLPDFSDALDQFRAAGGPAAWLEKFWADENHRRSKWMKTLNALAMSAHYSPNPSSPSLGIDFPFNLQTGAFDLEVWRRWREWDPVNLVERHAANLKRLRLIYVDCGKRDEFSLQWGARALSAKLIEHGVTLHYEEFDDGHMSVGYRFDVSVPMVAKALSGA